MRQQRPTGSQLISAARVGAAAAMAERAAAMGIAPTLPDTNAAVPCAPHGEAQPPELAELAAAVREHLAELALADSFHHTMPAREVLRVIHPSRQRLVQLLAVANP